MTIKMLVSENLALNCWLACLISLITPVGHHRVLDLVPFLLLYADNFRTTCQSLTGEEEKK